MNNPIEEGTIDTSQFSQWLQNRKNLQPESIKDILSRIKRVYKFIDVYKNDEMLDIRFKLEKNQEYMSLPAAVKSQLKRSMFFLLEFLKEDDSS